MNTPDPCGDCGNLYADCMQEDDPSYIPECMKEHNIFNAEGCVDYIYWEDGGWMYPEGRKRNK